MALEIRRSPTDPEERSFSQFWLKIVKRLNSYVFEDNLTLNTHEAKAKSFELWLVFIVYWLLESIDIFSRELFSVGERLFYTGRFSH